MTYNIVKGRKKIENEVNVLAFPINSTLLDAMVLAIVDREDTYGYKITQNIRAAMEVSESTLYPVLRRLLKESDLETYDREFQGRNRRYYRTTPKGKATLLLYKEEWKLHKKKIDDILLAMAPLTQSEFTADATPAELTPTTGAEIETAFTTENCEGENNE